MLVAFTRFAAKNHQRPSYYKDVIRASSRIRQVAHLPQANTSETLCGHHIYELAEVDEKSDIAACKTCKSRLAAAERRQPGSGFRLLSGGNNLLPAPNM